MKISTRLFFSAAHRLSDYDGKCARPHGHSWVVDIEIESEKLERNGLMIDFNDINTLVEDYDHRLLVLDCEENHRFFGNLPEDWVCWLKFNPTCENFASNIKENFILLLGKSRNIEDYNIKVKVYETYKPIKASYAEV